MTLSSSDYLFQINGFHGFGVDGVKYFSTKKDGSPLDVDPYILIEKQGTNIFVGSNTPTTQTITVAVGTPYTVSLRGTGNITLSNAGVGVVTESSPITFTATTTSLTCTVSGVLVYAQVEPGTQFASSHIPTTTFPAARAADILKYNFGAGNFPQEFCYLADFEPLIDGVTSAIPEDYRIFGTQDSTGREYRTFGNVTIWKFDINGVVRLVRNDFATNSRTNFAIKASTSTQEIIKDGENIDVKTNSYYSNHSNTGTLEIANWAGAVMPMKIYRAIVTSPLKTRILKYMTKVRGKYNVN
jgi:hypothetical protein